MSNEIITTPPGIVDIFPDETMIWNFIINTARDVFYSYNYKEIIIPILEYTEVFSRGLGNETDIVSKEMFSFEDRGGRSLTLRPEGTASVVRAYVNNGEYNRLASCKFFYFGPMFRAEKPQKGRLRQFNQFGAEVFGNSNPYHDYEIISLMNIIAERLGITDFSLLINSIGCLGCREGYIDHLRSYYQRQSSNLCNDCLRRLERNPLRLLDCKNDECKKQKSEAPVISSFLCKDCKNHYTILKEYLDLNSIDYTEDPYLVRGLDYYTKTTFEFVTDMLGGQNAFAAGGRYDNLVETFGGKPTPAIGFAAGIERIFLLVKENKLPTERLDIFIVYSGDQAFRRATQLCEMLRSNKISVDLDPNSRGLKSQLKKADREGARLALIIGEEEIEKGKYTIKDMQTGEQNMVEEKKIIEFLTSSLKL